MFRFMQNYVNKPAPAMYAAGSDMKQGMGVVIDGDEVKFPTAATAENIFIATRERIAEGAELVYGDMPDYSDIFENIKSGSLVVAVRPTDPERFFTDQFTGTLAEGDMLVVGTDGKFAKAESGASSCFKVVNAAYKDCGTHTGILVQVVEKTTVSE